MHWLLAGYCGLALINISVALKVKMTQRPRVCVKATKRAVRLNCMISEEHSVGEVEWYKADEYNSPTKIQILPNGQRIVLQSTFNMNVSRWRNFYLYMQDLRTEDSGMYFCNMEGTWGPGTYLQVVRPVNHEKAAYRTKMKDGLMILQGLLLAVIIAAVLLRKRTMMEKSDSIYEEPETDHIYEGLTIETCGGGLYEELSVYAQADGAEAPWE